MNDQEREGLVGDLAQEMYRCFACPANGFWWSQYQDHHVERVRQAIRQAFARVAAEEPEDVGPPPTLEGVCDALEATLESVIEEMKAEREEADDG